jgi:hypothetical protein
VAYNRTENRPRVIRDGVERDWAREVAIWAAAPGSSSPISLGRRKGELRIQAGGRVFTSSVDDEGHVSVRSDEAPR